VDQAERTFPCRQCGATLSYAPGTDALRCGYCGTDNPIPATPAAGGEVRELDFRRALETLAEAEPLEETRTVKCSACAAEFSFDGAVHADACPYCGGAIVTDTGVRRQFKPRALVPFAIEAKDARDRLKDWLGSLWFAPSDVQRYAREEGRLTGVYVPYWTFDAETRSRYSGERGTAHQVPQRMLVQEQGRTVERTVYRTEMRWSPASGRVARAFDDILVLASRTLPRHVVERLGSWRLGALVPYRDEYVSGFRSEAYQVDLEDGFALAREEMAAAIRQDVAMDIGGDAQRIHSIETDYGRITFKHVLLPIWSAAYRYGDKAYRFVVNGQTGEVQGERPYSVWKIALAVVVALVVLGALAYGFQMMESGTPSTY
jgi:DNA-directed RNA polymerase subunit RPC12/RpoP